VTLWSARTGNSPDLGVRHEANFGFKAHSQPYEYRAVLDLKFANETAAGSMRAANPPHQGGMR
jgi:hypothetical protein